MTMTTTLTGKMLIGAAAVAGTDGGQRAFNPATNAEIATSLDLREGTVKSYLQSAMAKLDASTRHAAVATARRAGLLP